MPEARRGDESELSFWMKEAGAPSGQVALEGPVEADVCIVGGGFTGLWTALEIARREPGAKVVILEQAFCGSGASGRNAGFVLSFWAKFESLAKACGTDEALRLARASSEAVVSLGPFCDDHDIDAHYRRDGWLWSATSTAQLGAWSSTLRAIEAHGDKPFESVGDEVAARISGSPRAIAGVVERDAATIQPALLARGLRRVALEAGVSIFEGSPMTRLERGERPVVGTPRGEVRARRVVLATNAWGVALAEIRKAIVVVSSDMIVTKPIPDLLRRCGRTSGVGVSDSRMLIEYDRTTLDGRLAFGKGGGGGTLGFGARLGASFDGVSPIAPLLRERFGRMYPDLADSPIEQSWTGPIARSWDGLPFFGRLPGSPHILYAVGYSGNGLGPSRVGARILGSLALDIDDEWSNAGLVRPLVRNFPPEPLRYWGGKLVRRAVAKRDDADDDGRRPGALVRSLAALAPDGVSPFVEPD